MATDIGMGGVQKKDDKKKKKKRRVSLFQIVTDLIKKRTAKLNKLSDEL